MFGFYGTAPESNEPPFPSSYQEQIRAAHALADMLKRTRPQLGEKVDALQSQVRRCQTTLDESKEQLTRAASSAKRDGHSLQVSSQLSPETLAALKELEEATQALLDLRHKGQMAR